MSFGEDIAALVALNSYGALSAGPGWPRVQLGDVAKIVNGFAFESRFFNLTNGLPLVRIRDLVEGGSDTFYSGPVPHGYSVDDGDLLVGMDGDFNSALWRGGPALLNQRVCKIVPEETKLRRRFLAYALPAYLKLINDYTSSVTVKHLSSRTLQALPLPLPAVDAQDALVTRIDGLFAEIDDGERALAAAREGVETYRESLLKAAVTGKLTADWRRANPPAGTGEGLLKRIRVGTRRNVASTWRPEDLNGPNTQGLPALPSGWTWASLAQLSTEPPRNGLSIKEATAVTGVRALKLNALTNEGVDWTQFRYLPRAPDAVRRYLLAHGDLLVSRANGSSKFVGRASLCSNPPADMIFPDTAIRFRIGGDDAVRTWISAAWSSTLIRSQILRRAKSTAGILKVSQDDLRSIAIPLPGPSEILEIVATLARLADATTGEERALTTLPTSASTLRQSILAAAFRGELVP